MTPPIAHVAWPKTHRLINSAYPPIDVFEDIADPADWDLLAGAEEKTNPRLAETIGNLDLVPVSRRVGGEGASWVMACFTHFSTDRQGRFHDGTYGAYYGARSFETALFETVHHRQAFCSATGERPGWIADMRELVGAIDTRLVDIRGGDYSHLLHKTDYAQPQAFARQLIGDGHDGVVYPSVRHRGGECFAAFYPDVVSIPVQGRHLSYYWDGSRIDKIRIYGEQPGIYAIDP
ncbi:MAG: RES family NAD+ phosphorylase [Alphaproteobacteria bacterium]|nr:RES family NAD+ phosphorylase [Alphaproteobacteria bacterium]